MATMTIVYWRDIPAQVIIGKGRRAAKVQLPERFEQAIDRCAMKVGAKDDDAYLVGMAQRSMHGRRRRAMPQNVATETATRLDARNIDTLTRIKDIDRK